MWKPSGKEGRTLLRVVLDRFSFSFCFLLFCAQPFLFQPACLFLFRCASHLLSVPLTVRSRLTLTSCFGHSLPHTHIQTHTLTHGTDAWGAARVPRASFSAHSIASHEHFLYPFPALCTFILPYFLGSVSVLGVTFKSDCILISVSPPSAVGHKISLTC